MELKYRVEVPSLNNIEVGIPFFPLKLLVYFISTYTHTR